MSKVGDKAGNLPTLRPDDAGQTGVNSDRGGQSGVSHSQQLGTDKRVMTAADIERVASQAGFARGGKRKGPMLGDSSQAPIPLPDDDVDIEEWSMPALEDVQKQFLLQKNRLSQSRRRGHKSLLGMWQALLANEDQDGDGQSDEDTATRQAQIEAMAKQVPPDNEAMAQLVHSVRAQLGVDLQGEGVGTTLMAASLLVAGRREPLGGPLDALQAEDAPNQAAAKLDPQRLFDGAQALIEDSRAAAENVHDRVAGMQRNLAVQRTFVPKR